MEPPATGPKSAPRHKKGTSRSSPKSPGAPAAPREKRCPVATESGQSPPGTTVGKKASRPAHRKKPVPRKLVKARTEISGSSESKAAAEAEGKGKPPAPGVKVAAGVSAPGDRSAAIVAHAKTLSTASVRPPTQLPFLADWSVPSDTASATFVGRGTMGMSPRTVSHRSGLTTPTSAGSTSFDPPFLSPHMRASVPNSESSSPSDVRPGTRSSNQAKCRRVAAQAAAIMTVTCALLLYLMRQSALAKAFKRTSLCITPACRYHADVIAALVNTSLDPCDDFEAYACSRWAPSFRVRTYGTAMMLQAENVWIDKFHGRLEEAMDSIRLAKQLEMLFETCAKRRSAEETTKEISEITEFMRELKLRWPQPPLPGVEPLGVILSLVINWAIDIWFRAYLETTDKGDSRNLVLQPGTLFTARWGLAQDIFQENAYVKYWTGFHRMIAPGETMRSQPDILKIAAMEKNIYSDFMRAENSSLKNPALIQLADIRGYTPHIPTRQWIDALNNNLMGHGEFLASDSVTVADVDLLRAVNNLFANLSREQLLDHISWEFIQLLVPVAGSDFLVAKYGDETQAEINVNNFCASQIEKAYRWLVTAALLLPRFDANARAVVDEELANITDTAIAKVTSLSWADNASVELIADRLQNMRVVIWPPDSLLTDTALFKTFGSWFREDLTFTQHFILALRKWQRVRLRPMHRSRAESPPSFHLPFLNYDPVSNAVRISSAALFMPWYHVEESKATFYGGFGFTFARKVVRMFDGFTLAFDRRGKLLKTWPSAAWKEASKKKAACLRPQFETFFPEIPALEIAHALYLSSAGDRARSLPIAKGWSPDRVFFVTACFTMCSLPTTLSRFRLACNKAMMNFAPFAKAYDCPVNSKMNPPRKCTYFD